MGGRDAQRGFIFQSIIAMIECLERDDWDEVKLEPDTDNDKVDIQLYKDRGILSALQVKSSKNKFARCKVRKWLEELTEDAADALEVRLCLVGDSYTPACEKYIVSHPEVEKYPFSTLKDNCIVKLQDYIAYVGYDTQVDDSELHIAYNHFFAEIHNNSIADTTLSRNDLKQLLKRFLSIPKCLTEIPGINRNIGIIGRDEVILYLRRKLDQNGSIVLLSSCDGVGKTAIMRWICNSIKDDDNAGNHVAWITCGKSLRDDILLLRDSFGILAGEDDITAFNQIIEKMKSFDGTLYLFMDNMFRNPDSDEMDVLNSLHPNVHIMITSKDKVEGIPAVELETLEPDSAVSMFCKYYYYNRDQEQRYYNVIEDIVSQVHCYTFLVELLARAARRLGGTLEDFNNELKAKGFVNIFQRTYITDYTGNLTIEEIVGDYNEFVGKQQEQTE